MKKEENNGDNKFGFSSFLLGLFSTLFFWTAIPPIIMGGVGITLSILQIKKKRNNLAISGLILSIVGFISGIIILIILIKIANIAILSAECNAYPPNSDACNQLFQKFPEFFEYQQNVQSQLQASGQLPAAPAAYYPPAQ